MIDKEKIKDELVELIENSLRIEAKQIDVNQNIFELLEMDSLLLIEMIVNIENKFNIELYDEELDYNSFSTLSKIIEIIIRHKNEQIV